MKRSITIVKFVFLALGCVVILGCETTMTNVATYKEQQDVEKLITVVNNTENLPSVRQKAAASLGDIGDKRAVEALVRALQDGNTFLLRKEAAQALVKIGDKRAVEPLSGLLKNNNKYIRKMAANALSRIGDESPVEPLIAALKDEFHEVREEAARALTKIGEPAIKPLVATLKDEDADVREQAATALDELGWTPGNDAERAFFYVAKKDWRRCLQVDKSAIVEPLIIALKSDNPKVREGAVQVLGQTNDQRVVEALINVLRNDESERVKRFALTGLGNLKGAKAIEALVFAALQDADTKVQERARSMLLDIKDPKAVDVYIAILNTDLGETRLKAAKILVDLDEPKAIEVREQASKVIDAGIPVTEVTTCNAYGQPVTVVLKNRDGQDVAKRERKFSGSFIVLETLIDLSTGQEIKSWTFDQYSRRMQAAMVLCLDEKANILRDEKGNPVLVKTFPARQRSMSRIRYSEYNSTIKAGETRTIYPCENCAEHTGFANCSYVW